MNKISFQGEDVLTADPGQLVEAYSRFIKMFVFKYRSLFSAAADEDDFFQVGAIGLLAAQKNFDPEKYSSFATYAAYYIKNYIRCYAIGFKRDGTKKQPPTISLDEGLPGLEDVLLLETIPDESIEDNDERAIRLELEQEVREAVKRIKSPKKREIIERHYFKGESFSSIAKEQNISSQAIGQRNLEALSELRRDWRLNKCLFPDLKKAGVGRFRETGNSIVEQSIIDFEREYNRIYGQDAYLNKPKADD